MCTGTILLDTVGLDPKFGKTFPKDIEIVQRLHDLDPSVDKQAFFTAIQDAKFDISSLGTSDLLIKDYKDWTANNGVLYGMSKRI
jgi:exopolyphosphatase